MPLNLRWLHTFMSVVETGGFSHAANHLNLSQSGVSLHIQKLEKLAQAELLDRHGFQRPQLTAAGRGMYQLARQINNLVNLVPHVALWTAPGTGAASLLDNFRRHRHSAFLGRELDAAQILHKLEHSHLAVLVAEAGTGTSSLAHEVVNTYSGRCQSLYINLAGISRAALVPGLLALQLELTGEHLKGRTAAEATAAAIGNVPTVLLLDHLEPELLLTGFDLEWLATCSGLRVLITTSQWDLTAFESDDNASPLAQPPSQWPVQEILGLVFPSTNDPLDIAQLQEIPAVAVLVSAIRQQHATFHLHEGNASVISALCAAVKGHPLALELLAGAAVRASDHAVLQTLRQSLSVFGPWYGQLDLPDELTAALDTAFLQLTVDEGRFARRLALFTDDFDAAAAGAVAFAAQLPQPGTANSFDLAEQAEALLETLMLQAFVRSPYPGRYTLPNAVRIYLHQQLAQAQEIRTSAFVLATYYLNLARETHGHGTQLQDLHNYRNSIYYWIARDRYSEATQMVDALSDVWRLALPEEALFWKEQIRA